MSRQSRGMIVAGTLIFALLFSLTIRSASAERVVGVTWDRTYVSAIPGTSSVEQVSDGGFIISAEGRGQEIMKANTVGLPEWQKEYTPVGFVVCCDSVTRTVMQTSDGGYIIVGTVLSNGYVTGFDGWVLKLNSRGSVEWSKTYGGANDDTFVSGLQTSDGGYIVAGNTQSFGSPYHISNGWVLRLGEEGNIVWQETFEGQEVHSIDQTSDGGFIVAGSVGVAGLADAWLLKMGRGGTVEWQKAYDFRVDDNTGSIQGAFSAHQTTDGGYIAVAEKMIFRPYGGSLTSEALILRLDPNGDTLWLDSYNGGGFTTAYSVQQFSDMGFIIAGRFQPSFASLGGSYVGSSGPWLLRLDSSGDMIWQNIYGGENDLLIQAQETRDGGIIAVGSKDGNCCANLAWALKLDSAGSIRGCPVGVKSNATLTDTSAVVTSTTVAGVPTNATGTSTDVTVTAPLLLVQNQCDLQNQQARDENKHTVQTPLPSITHM